MAFKYRIYPNAKQRQLIQKTFGCVRFVYNYYLAQCKQLLKENQPRLTYKQCSRDLTQLKIMNPWLKESDKFALQNALRDLDRAYENFFTKEKVGYPRFKSKKSSYQSYKTNFTNNNIEFLGKEIKLPKLGKLRIRDKRCPLGRVISATLSRNASGQYFISLCCTDMQLDLWKATHQSVGIDLGLKDYAITSDGVKYKNPRYFEQSFKRLAFLQRALSRKTRGSSNWEKAKLRLARLYLHVANQRKDYLHKLSHEIVRQYDVISVEKLKVANMVKNHHLSRNIEDASWAEFRRQLKYKANWYGKTFTEVDTFYPSSQICSACGYQNAEVKNLSVRFWQCPQCHAYHDRDMNAAINIREQGIKLINQG